MRPNSNFETLYNLVFNIDGSEKACDKQIKQQLIKIANHLNPGLDFGDIKTGRININNMNTLYMAYMQFGE